MKDPVRAPVTLHTGNKTLLIGDSLLSAINKKGLKRQIHKHAIGGAAIQSIVDEIAVYDLKTFLLLSFTVGETMLLTIQTWSYLRKNTTS